jgi:DNA-binding response OmpR family regulator
MNIRPEVHALIADCVLLLVDDSSELRAGVRRQLQVLGARVVEAEDGAEMLDAVRKQHIDAVLLDIDMPIMDGLRACRLLRADPALMRTPVLFLTGRGESHSEVDGLMAGGDDFVTKPFASEVLVARIYNLVRRRRAELEVERLLGMLQQYVPRPVRERRVAQPVEEIVGTILFSDMRGFTAKSLNESPAGMFEAISTVLAHQTSFIAARGGYVDKFSGDGLLAVFEGENSTRAAFETASDIVRWARTFDGISFWQPPPIGVGVHHGRFLRGDLGSAEQMEFTVIGSTVNIAARLCGSAGALEVVASDEAVRQVGASLRFATPRIANLKGLPPGSRLHPLVVDG